MKTIIENATRRAMNYAQYNWLFKQLVEDGKTTGEPSQEKIDYTKLNFSRSKRLDKTAIIPERFAKAFAEIPEKQTWLVICEPWCGDAAQTLPYLNKIALESPNIELKIVLRDENPQLMDAFLTAGTRSIPIVIMLGSDFTVLQSWGPRSKAATHFIATQKTETGFDEALKTQLQIWYLGDKGFGIMNDMLEAMHEVKIQ